RMLNARLGVVVALVTLVEKNGEVLPDTVKMDTVPVPTAFGIVVHTFGAVQIFSACAVMSQISGCDWLMDVAGTHEGSGSSDERTSVTEPPWARQREGSRDKARIVRR